MNSSLSPAGDFLIKVYEGNRLVASLPLSRATEIGRREPNEPMPYVRIPRADSDRIIVADLPETSVSRRHLRIVPRGEGEVELVNESAKSGIALAGGARLAPGARLTTTLPTACELGTKLIHLEWRAPEDVALRSLSDPAPAPGQSSSLVNFRRRSSTGDTGLATMVGGGQSTDVLGWLQMSMEVFQSAAGSADFLQKAVSAAAQMVELDTVAILLKRGADWARASVARRDATQVPDDWRGSSTILARVAEQRRTFYQAPAQRPGIATSLVGVQSVVAAPILDAQGELIGVLYGEGRSSGATGPADPVTELEAKMFELLAFGVASGLARTEQERKLVAQQVRFEQFFTPELARELQARGDDMLAAREADVTVLFCDIKGFSRISADCGAALAIEWVREVLSELSDRVAEHQGVLVDYGGDSLEALWGAPLSSAEHAVLACRAALAMRGALPGLNQRWQARLGRPTDISVGINSGPAQVGNIGSRRKFKYGAFGTTVNLASRVQGATKFLGVSTLVTRATVQQLDDSFATRRLGTVRTVNIPEPVELLELVAKPDDAWHELRRTYEQALAQFEAGRFIEALQGLGNLVARFPDDQPTRRLLLRNVSALSQAGEPFDPVWNLDGK